MKSLQELLKPAPSREAYQFLKSDMEMSPQLLAELFSLMIDTVTDSRFELLPDARNRNVLMIRQKSTGESAPASIRNEGQRFSLMILNDIDARLGTDSDLIAELWGDTVTVPAAPLLQVIIQIAAHSDSIAFLPGDERSRRRAQEAERLNLPPSIYIRLASSTLVRSLRLE